VSPYAGTTRDLIEVHLDLDGYPVNLLDTAGVHEASGDPVEREGIRRAREATGRADLVLWVVDAEASGTVGSLTGLLEPIGAEAARWIVLNKVDLIDARTGAELKLGLADRSDVHFVSATNGQGLGILVAALTRFAAGFFTSEPALVTRQRQHTILSEVADALARACAIGERAGESDELVAEHLRRAAAGLGRLTGRVDVEEILAVIFRDFCVGK
jgi:tRNA modification GTPase